MTYNTTSNFSTRLRFKIQIAIIGLADTWRKMMVSPNFNDLYKEYLLTIHSIIRSSVPLMKAAYEKCHELEEGPLRSALINYYRKHIPEEMHHDEWLLDDLEILGTPRRESLYRKPSQLVAELVGSQYYWIYHWHPICLIGYIAVLEGYPLRKEEVDYVRLKTGLPETAFRTIAKHSYLDPDHRHDLDNMLDSLSLSKIHEEWITINALITADKCREILRNIY